MEIKRSDLERLVTQTNFTHKGTTTVCVLHVVGGAEISGESKCTKKEDYNKFIGEKIAKENAYKKLAEFETYAETVKQNRT